MLSLGIRASGPVTAAVASLHSTVIARPGPIFWARFYLPNRAVCSISSIPRTSRRQSPRSVSFWRTLRRPSSAPMRRPPLRSPIHRCRGVPCRQCVAAPSPRRCRRAGDFQRRHHTVADGRRDLGQQLRLNHPQLGRPGRRFGRHAEHPVTQCGRGRVFGDLLPDHRRPVTEHRALGDVRRPARAFSPGRAPPCPAAADRARRDPDPTNFAAVPRRGAPRAALLGHGRRLFPGPARPRGLPPECA